MNDVGLTSPVEALFPDAETRRRLLAELDAKLEAALQELQAGPVTPTIDMASFHRELSIFDFAAPQDMRSVLDWTLEQLKSGIVQMSNPRYYGLFNPGANFPAQCAERIAALFNPQLASSASSPVPVALEDFLIRKIAERAGMGPKARGHFATGGSEANYTALICALTQAHPDFGRDGVRALPGPVAFYTSRDCHIAWLKIAHMAGVGRAALRLIDTDGKGRLAPSALHAAIVRDRSLGVVPVMVVATAGTTGAGMIDPLRSCADIAMRERLWFHVDAAWGGAALASERLRAHLDGIELSDSLTIDAHKWLATTMGCALFITRRPELLSEAFHASTSFMPSSVAGVDPYLNSVQWSRRFLGLRLFLALAAAGWPGLALHVERAVEVIERVREALVQRGWTIVNDSPLAVLDALPPPELGAVRALVKRVVNSGRAWVAPTNFEGRDVVRICATNGQTSLEDIDALIAALNQPEA